MPKIKGFTLLETMIVLAVVSSLLLGLMQVQRGARQQQSMLLASQEMNALAAAIYHHLVLHDDGSLSALTISDLQSNGLYQGRTLSPWETPYELLFDETSFIVQVDLGHAMRAERLAGMLANARVNNTRVESYVPVPIRAADASAALHRYAQPDSPELNQMFTSIHMNQHSITDIDGLFAEDVESQWLTTHTLTATNLHAMQFSADVMVSELAQIDELTAALADLTSVSVGQGYFDTLVVDELYGASASAVVAELYVDQLLADTLQINNLYISEQLISDQATVNNAYFQFIQADITSTEHLNAQSISTIYGMSEHLFASVMVVDDLRTDVLRVHDSFTADRVYADAVYANDVITPFGSMSQFHQQLEQYQQLWHQCIDAGGCR
ncbi:type II secretion system protein [Aliidiomarina indica]|uniref:type II secretion system protein n=1 Tax=Aliidiomarina indica TaxID=2749147 RepID=UPI001E517C67|nr:type II secretion system protein [Aliidiomarina indica]